MWKNNSEIILAVVAVLVAIVVGVAYIPFYQNGWCKCFEICIDGVDKDPTRTALALAGAVLVIANMWFIVIRIRRTDKQIEKTEEQDRRVKKYQLSKCTTSRRKYVVFRQFR